MALEFAKHGRAERRVLVVDDDRINRTVAFHQLAELGVASDCAENGVEALKMVAERNYDLALVDISMPVMGGMEFTDQVRQGEQGGNDGESHLPIIAVTSTVNELEQAKFLAGGMDGVLIKPMDPEKLARVLETWLFRTNPPRTDSLERAANQETQEQCVDIEELSWRLGEDDETVLFEILEMFTDEFPKLLARIEDGLASHDAQALKNAAHAAKSAALNVGAVPLSRMLADLEAAAPAADWAGLGGAIRSVGSEFAGIIEFRRGFLGEGGA